MPPPLRAEVRQVGWEAGVVLQVGFLVVEGTLTGSRLLSWVTRTVTRTGQAGTVAPLRGHRSSSRWTLDTSRGGSLTGGEGVVPRCLLDWISVALVPGAIVKNWIFIS